MLFLGDLLKLVFGHCEKLGVDGLTVFVLHDVFLQVGEVFFFALVLAALLCAFKHLGLQVESRGVFLGQLRLSGHRLLGLMLLNVSRVAQLGKLLVIYQQLAICLIEFVHLVALCGLAPRPCPRTADGPIAGGSLADAPVSYAHFKMKIVHY